MALARKVWGWARGLAVFLAAVFIGLVVTFGLERAVGKDRVLRGVTMNGRPVAGFDASTLERLLFREDARLGARRVELTLAGETLSLPARDLSLSLDVKAAVKRALAQGREGSWFGQLGFWLARLVGPHDTTMPVRIDEERLVAVVGPFSEKILPSPALPRVSFDEKLSVEEGSGGSRLDIAGLKGSLSRVAASETADPLRVVVPSVEKARLVPLERVSEVRKRAEALLEGPLHLRVEGSEGDQVLSPAVLGQALFSEVDESKRTFTLHLDMTVIRSALEEFLLLHEKLPVEAGFEFSPRGEVIVTPSAPGIRLDEAKFVERVWAGSGTKERLVVIPLESAPPKLTTERAQTLGVRGLVGVFVTHHECCQPRVDNIHRAAAQLDGTVLMPGDKFSLNEALGPRTQASGYRSAPTIVRGEMEDVYGGGISQLATTLFNAVLRGGYEIIQRQPHSIYFSRYPEGHEATVSYPEPDLIFRNDTKAGMVIRMQFTGTFIKVLLFGDAEGRRVRVDKSARRNVVQPPIEYEADDSLEPGETKRVRAGQLGWTVEVSRTIEFVDGRKKHERREVVYNPRPELVRAHSCIIPKGQEGYTGDDCPEPEREEREEELSDDEYFETIDPPEREVEE